MPYLLFLKKQQVLKLSSAANYRWRFKGYNSGVLWLIWYTIKLGIEGFLSSRLTAWGDHYVVFFEHLLIVLVQPWKAGNRPNMTEKLLTGM